MHNAIPLCEDNADDIQFVLTNNERQIFRMMAMTVMFFIQNDCVEMSADDAEEFVEFVNRIALETAKKNGGVQ